MNFSLQPKKKMNKHKKIEIAQKNAKLYFEQIKSRYFEQIKSRSKNNKLDQGLKHKYYKFKALNAILVPNIYTIYLLDLLENKSLEEEKSIARTFHKGFYNSLDEDRQKKMSDVLVKKMPSILFYSNFSIRYLFRKLTGETNFNLKISNLATQIAKNECVIRPFVIIDYFENLIQESLQSYENRDNLNKGVKNGLKGSLDKIYNNLNDNKMLVKSFSNFSAMYTFFNVLAAKLSKENSKVETMKAYQLAAYFSQVKQGFVDESIIEKAGIKEEQELFGILITKTKKLVPMPPSPITVFCIISIVVLVISTVNHFNKSPNIFWSSLVAEISKSSVIVASKSLVKPTPAPSPSPQPTNQPQIAKSHLTAGQLKTAIIDFDKDTKTKVVLQSLQDLLDSKKCRKSWIDVLDSEKKMQFRSNIAKLKTLNPEEKKELVHKIASFQNKIGLVNAEADGTMSLDKFTDTKLKEYMECN